ncbi:hypothetical protein SAMN02910436_02488 [Ruminococcaceae bacterium P7]|nr:hypothetical protein SAMN02910436_02488 [Ruminococcaceae bacterium P7]
MALTLAEVSVGLSDKVAQGVIDEFRRSSQFMDLLTFDNTVSPGTGGSTMIYGYQQLSTPSAATGRAINEEYTADEAKREKKTAYLKIFGGSAAIDRVLNKTSPTEVSFQLKQKILATKNHFQYTCINGSKTANAKDFDGLSTLLTGKSTECNVGASAVVLDLSTSANLDSNYKSAIDMLNDFIATLNGKPTMFLGNSKIISRLKSIAFRAGYNTRSEDKFGQSVQGYDNILFYDMGKYYDKTNSVTKDCVPIYSTGSGNNTVTGLTDLYAVQFGLDSFHGASLSGGNIIDTYLPNFKDPGAVKKLEVEMIAAVVLKDTTKCGVLRNIKVE